MNMPLLVLNSDDFEIDKNDYLCGMCNSTVNHTKENCININVLMKHDIKILTDKYKDMIWSFDFKKINHQWPEKVHNKVCYNCLERLADSGIGHQKPTHICNLCSKLFCSEMDWDGMVLEGPIDYPGYGSRWDMQKCEFDLPIHEFYCYKCLDEYLDKRNGK